VSSERVWMRSRVRSQATGRRWAIQAAIASAATRSTVEAAVKTRTARRARRGSGGRPRAGEGQPGEQRRDAGGRLAAAWRGVPTRKVTSVLPSARSPKAESRRASSARRAPGFVARRPSASGHRQAQRCASTARSASQRPRTARET